MVTGPTPDRDFVCPLCSGTLATWSRENLVVEFCEGCAALFLDRGELFDMFRAEGYRCPPEAFLRASFESHEGQVLVCPKCLKESLVPGAVEGCEVWHCTPCNGFLVERDHLLGMEVGDAHLEISGFRRRGGGAKPGDARVAGYLARMLQRVAFRTPPDVRTAE